MAFSETLATGPDGSIVLAETGGVLTLTACGNLSLGGGEAAGVATAKASVSVVLTGWQLVQLGLNYLKTKLPAAMQPAVTALETVAIPFLKTL